MMQAEVTVAQMKELERAADAAGLSYRQMMENAGAAAARILTSRLPGLRSAAVFCGSGNNGGDGYVLARLLHEAGVRVTVITVQGAAKTADAAANAEAAAALGIPILALDSLTPEQAQDAARADAAVDALYGTGFHGALSPAARRAAALMNACRFVLALDVPSGVAADTGAVAEGSVRADATVFFHAPKACRRLAAAQCGEAVTADIGIRA